MSAITSSKRINTGQFKINTVNKIHITKVSHNKIHLLSIFIHCSKMSFGWIKPHSITDELFYAYRFHKPSTRRNCSYGLPISNTSLHHKCH